MFGNPNGFISNSLPLLPWLKDGQRSLAMVVSWGAQWSVPPELANCLSHLSIQESQGADCSELCKIHLHFFCPRAVLPAVKSEERSSTDLK